MQMERIIEKFRRNPNQLFVIDGTGAMLSAFLLGVLLVRFEQFFGIPSSMLYVLACLPVGFAVYDYFGFQKDKEQSVKYLKGIAVMNLLYCGLSIGWAGYHQATLTKWGWSYIILEVIIVTALALLELRVASKVRNEVDEIPTGR